MTVRLQLRRDTSANWSLANPVLALGEVGLDTSVKKLKVGDGSQPWNSLDYFLTGPAGESPKSRRSDYVAGYSYCGTAPKDSPETSQVWVIKKIFVNPDGSVSTTSASNVAWSNRLSANYS